MNAPRETMTPEDVERLMRRLTNAVRETDNEQLILAFHDAIIAIRSLCAERDLMRQSLMLLTISRHDYVWLRNNATSGMVESYINERIAAIDAVITALGLKP